MKINILSKQVADMIAAGEVVERPASVIKELTENSVDAGAKRITVEIQHGGITYMRVTDDGCGIERSEIEKVFLAHATSKIKDSNDLEHIITMGFRGEAVASVSAVSRTEIMTKTADEPTGTAARCEGGEITLVDDAGCPDGTTVVVRDIFFNTPARLKFLKKDVSEGNYVAGTVDKLALSHPGISVRFIREGRQVLLTSGDGNVENCIFSVFGKDFVSGLLPAEYKYEDVNINGFISKPYASKNNRAMQYVFVNSRPVMSRTVSAALDAAYRNSVMTGKFPACVIYITLPPEAVDVNVHPAKTEVRFSNEKKLFDAVYYCVKSVLSQSDEHKPFVFEQTPQVNPEKKRYESHYEYQYVMPAGTGNPAADVSGSDNKPDPPQPEVPQPEIISLKEDTPLPQESSPAPEKDEVPDTVIKTEQSEQRDSHKVIGEAFSTYIFVQSGDSVFLIDKHAAHERMIYEKLRASRDAADMQMLIAPVSVTLSKQEYSAINENRDILSKAGYEIDDFGPGTVAVRGIPSVLSESCDVTALVSEIAGHLLDKKELLPDRLDWIYHSTACRAAVKGGDKTSEYELEQFTDRLIADPSIRYCPHGRPVLIEMSRADIEKQFGRIV